MHSENGFIMLLAAHANLIQGLFGGAVRKWVYFMFGLPRRSGGGVTESCLQCPQLSSDICPNDVSRKAEGRSTTAIITFRPAVGDRLLLLLTPTHIYISRYDSIIHGIIPPSFTLSLEKLHYREEAAWSLSHDRNL